MRKLLSKIVEYFKSKKKMSYTSQEVNNITTLLNQGINNFSFLMINNPPSSYYEINFYYKNMIQFSVFYKIGGDVDFIYKTGSIVYLDDLSVQLVNLTYILSKQKNNIIREFQQLLHHKGRPV